MPPTPKPPDRRQRTNTPGVGLIAMAGGAEPAPAPPPGMLKSTQQAWADYWKSDVATDGLVKRDSDLPAIRRLFSLYDERERCYRSARKGRIVPGSQGQPTLNPLYKHMTTLDTAITVLEDRFGLTPMARLKLGVQFADAADAWANLTNAAEADDDDDPRFDAIDTTATPHGRAAGL